MNNRGPLSLATSVVIAILLVSKSALAQSPDYILESSPGENTVVPVGSVDFKVWLESSPPAETVTLSLVEQTTGAQTQVQTMSKQGGSSVPGSKEYGWVGSNMAAGSYCWSVTIRFIPGNSGVASMSSWQKCFQVEEPKPSTTPSGSPTSFPTSSPTFLPSPMPTAFPTVFPTVSPTPPPSSKPTDVPTSVPTKKPTEFPTYVPTTKNPTKVPTKNPTRHPTFPPTPHPTPQPTPAPVPAPIPLSISVEIQKDQYYDVDETYWVVKKGNQVVFEQSHGHPTKTISPGKYCFGMTDNWGDGMVSGGYKVRVTGSAHPNGFVVYEGAKFKFSTGYLCFVVTGQGIITKTGPDPDALCPANDPSKFNMCVQTVDLSANGWLQANNLLTTYEQAFLDAKLKWENIIQGDDGSTHMTYYGLEVDDLHLYAVCKTIDQSGGTLAFASPSLTENVNGKIKAFSGYMVFDRDDIQGLVQDGTFAAVVAHEMGHIMGLGSLWDENNLFDKNNPSAGYNGPNANREFRKYMVSRNAPINVNDPNVKVPVELDGGAGTAFGHWDEDCLNHEIMTGYLDANNRLSKITIGGMEDLGFQVDYNKADVYNMPPARVNTCMEQILGNRKLKGQTKGENSHTPHGWARLLIGEPGRELSVEETEKAQKSGRKYLAQCKQATKGVVLGKGIKDVSCKAVDVIYRSTGGEVYEVGVVLGDEDSDNDVFNR